MGSIAVNTCNSGYGLWDYKLSQWNRNRLVDFGQLAVGIPIPLFSAGVVLKSEVIWGANVRPRSIIQKEYGW